MNPPDPNPIYQPPTFEWDHWETYALERGLDENLAALGRAVLREVVQHNWSPQMHRLCNQDVLLELLLFAPALGERLCRVLLETDGLRFAFAEGEDADNGMIELGF